MAAAAVHKRAFVVMTAQSFGGSFAREVDFYQNSKEADPSFAKAAKQRAKFLSQEHIHSAAWGCSTPCHGGYHPYVSASCTKNHR